MAAGCGIGSYRFQEFPLRGFGRTAQLARRGGASIPTAIRLYVYANMSWVGPLRPERVAKLTGHGASSDDHRKRLIFVPPVIDHFAARPRPNDKTVLGPNSAAIAYNNEEAP